MKSYLKRNGLFVAVAAVILILCVVLAGLTVSESALAQTDSFNQEDTVSIGHITDTHYYPFRLCYTDGAAIDTEDEYYFYNYIMSKSTKMWLEAEAIFDKALENFLVNTPDYIVLSGDVGQDGEILSHIDVANKLRALQNVIRTRTGNDKFQIFVILGNHDLYNEDTFRFDNATGTRETHLYTTRIEAVQIYAGLGYPNMTEEEATLFYEGLSADLPAGYTFVRSDLSSDFNYTWEFLTKNGTQNRVYHPDQDNADEITLAKMLKQGIVKTIDNTAFFRSTDMCYSYETKGDGTDLDIGQMTFIAQRVDGQFSFVGPRERAPSSGFVDGIGAASGFVQVFKGDFSDGAFVYILDHEPDSRKGMLETERDCPVNLIACIGTGKIRGVGEHDVRLDFRIMAVSGYRHGIGEFNIAIVVTGNCLVSGKNGLIAVSVWGVCVKIERGSVFGPETVSFAR